MENNNAHNSSERESREQLAFAIEAAELGTFDYNPLQGTFIANDRLKGWFGLPPGAEFDLSQSLVMIAETDRARVTAAIEAALEYNSGGNYDIVYSIVHPQTKKETIVRAKGKATFNDLQQAVRLTGTLENVTAERMASAKAIQNEQLLRNIVLEAPIGICVLDAATLVSEIVNESFLEVAGKPYEAVAGQYYWDSFVEARPYYEEALAGVVATGKPYYANEVELMLVRNGKEEYVFVTFVYAPLKDAAGKVIKVVVWVLENTQQVVARQKIQESTDKLNIVIEASGLGTYELNLQTDEILCSDRFREIFGYDNGQQLTHQQFIDHLHPDDLIIRDTAYQQALSTGVLSYQSRIIDRMGSVKWIDIHGKIFYDIQQRPAILIGTCGDITAIKEQEERKDFFIGAASHELKTPITSIKGYVQLLQKMHAGSDDQLLASSLKVMDRQTDVLVNLITELLDVSKIKLGKLSLNITSFDLEELLQETIQEVSAANPGCAITLVIEKNIQLWADRVRIGQVVVNLLNNAVRYSNTSDPIVVKATVNENNVTVSVKDAGVGISRQDQERIFERFFRAESSKEHRYDGMGIGLFISADIIHRHGGTIAVSSEPGNGSDFYFTLPQIP